MYWTLTLNVGCSLTTALFAEKFTPKKISFSFNKIEHWSIQRGMHFNVKNCNIMTNHTSLKIYHPVSSLRMHLSDVTISFILGWEEHVNTVAYKVNSRLGLPRRGLKGCRRPQKKTPYASLVHSMLEYTAAVWDPHLIKHAHLLGSSQKRTVKRHSDVKWVGPIRLHEGIKSHPDVSRRVCGAIWEELDLLPAHSPTRRNHHWNRISRLKPPYWDIHSLFGQFQLWRRLSLWSSSRGSLLSCLWKPYVTPSTFYSVPEVCSLSHKIKDKERTECSKAMLHSIFALFMSYAAPLAALYRRWK